MLNWAILNEELCATNEKGLEYTISNYDGQWDAFSGSRLLIGRTCLEDCIETCETNNERMLSPSENQD